MTMTDPIADFLTRLRNANSAYHDEVTLPSSKIKVNIAEILKREGYITDEQLHALAVAEAHGGDLTKSGYAESLLRILEFEGTH